MPLLYNEDNLKTMKRLDDESINLIYIDCLYGTGRNFGDYQDIKTSQSSINEHYEIRFKEMYRILNTTGTICVQTSVKTSHWFRILLDEIFGYNNFKNEIIWNYGGQSKKTEISNKYDVILRYTKSNKYTYNTQYKPHTERSKKEYRHLYEGNMCARTKRGNKYYYSPLNPLGTNITDVWDDIYYLTPSSKERNSVNYQSQKPIKLMDRIVNSFSNEGDMVADFYMGSGSFIVSATQLNRKAIGCDIGEKAFNITKERIDKEII